MTTEFVSAAELMARVLGADGYPFVVIDHPISSATPDQLEDRAREAVAQGMSVMLIITALAFVICAFEVSRRRRPGAGAGAETGAL